MVTVAFALSEFAGTCTASVPPPGIDAEIVPPLAELTGCCCCAAGVGAGVGVGPLTGGVGLLPPPHAAIAIAQTATAIVTVSRRCCIESVSPLIEMLGPMACSASRGYKMRGSE